MLPANLSIPDGHVLGTPGILVVKIEDEVIDAELGRLATADSSRSWRPPLPHRIRRNRPSRSMISRRWTCASARIVAAERVPKSEKLLKLQVEIGTEQRQVVAGIAQHYAPDDLSASPSSLYTTLHPPS